MKVIAFNGSARKEGNTAVLLNLVLDELKAEGIETEKMSADEFTNFVASEIAKWTPVAKSVVDAGSAR